MKLTKTTLLFLFSSIQICNTWGDRGNNVQLSNRKRRSTDLPNVYLSSETQFIMVSLSKGIYNSPPRLVSPDNVTMEEDEGIIRVIMNHVK